LPFSPSTKRTFSAALTAAILLFLLFNLCGCTPEPIYNGELKEGQPHGFGTLKHPNGAYYAGQFAEGLRHGRGTWIHPDGIRYAGEWQEDHYHGRGVLLTNSYIYAGTWNKGIKDGPGIQYWSDSQIYKGCWKDNRYDGFGIMLYVDGSTYRGEWLNGFRQGTGKAIYPDGSIYEGQWEKNLRNGYGQMIFADGTKYEGNWTNDLQHGEGHLIQTDGTIVNAVWFKGELQKIPVEGIELETENMTLVEGADPVVLKANVIPDHAPIKDVIWNSTDPSVAIVEDGVVEPVSSGTALITATTADGRFTASCIITVTDQHSATASINLDRTSIYLKTGETAVLIATLYPYDSSNTGLYWFSSDPSVASVDQEETKKGLVTAIATGEAWITVSTSDGKLTKSCLVNVTRSFDPEDQIIIPRLIGKTLDEAKKIANDTDLVIGEITFETHHTVPFGQVIEQYPSVGSVVIRDRLINLVISDGPPDQAEGSENNTE